MDDAEMRIALETNLTALVKNFSGRQIDQDLITSIWAATDDEIKNFNHEHFKFSKSAITWVHSWYVNHVIKIGTKDGLVTIGQLTTQKDSPKLDNVALVELYRMRKIFENTTLEGDIVLEINHRMSDDNGKTDKQASRSSVSTDN